MKLKFLLNTLEIDGPIKVGEQIGNFYLTTIDNKRVELEQIKGKWSILSFYPAINTVTCSAQLKWFFSENHSFRDQIKIINISADKPEVITKHLKKKGHTQTKQKTVYSDYDGFSFGKQAGVLIKKKKMLCRGVMVIDENRMVKYVQIVPRIEKQVDFNNLITFLEKIED